MSTPNFTCTDPEAAMYDQFKAEVDALCDIAAAARDASEVDGCMHLMPKFCEAIALQLDIVLATLRRRVKGAPE